MTVTISYDQEADAVLEKEQASSSDWGLCYCHCLTPMFLGVQDP